MIACRLLIQGHVQGVYYRQSTCRMALELGLAGTVRNLPDGSVEVIVEGNPENIKLLIDWCHKGPERARVDKIDIHETTLKNYSGFKISYQ